MRRATRIGSRMVLLGLLGGTLGGCWDEGSAPSTAPTPGRDSGIGPGQDATGEDAAGGDDPAIGPDNGTPSGDDEVVRLSGGSSDELIIDRFEASRPDATAQSSGSSTLFARSRSGVMPWSGATLAEAKAACQAAKARLCTRQELLRTCEGAGNWPYPYGMQRIGGACNDFKGPGTIVTTGSCAACATPTGVMDLVGNLAEWAEPEESGDEAVIAGGSEKLTALAVSLRLYTCAAEEQIPATMRRDDVGFRCCQRGALR